ncbi:MAG: dUTP diphosphatase [Desulfovibrionaceae bacterium]|nr:dUTP diphosphatase [Desulfovibrionaceae bacterium]
MSLSSFCCPVKLCYMREGSRALYEEAGLHYATSCSAGMDLRACFEAESLCIPAGHRALIPTGIAIQPATEGIAAFVYSRSGLGAKQGLTVAQGVGLIDPDYTGEIMVMLLNTSSQPHELRRGERMAQLVFQPYMRAELQTVPALTPTTRGSGGFGHTGK